MQIDDPLSAHLASSDAVRPDMAADVGSLARSLASRPPEEGSGLPMWLLPALGMMLGVKARKANHAKLAKAKEMHDQGIDRAIIRKATGWQLDPKDKSWKWEISDIPARVIGQPTPKYFARHGPAFDPMSQQIAHPELYENYPELGKIQTGLVEEDPGKAPSGAAWFKAKGDPSENQIEIHGADKGDIRATALHELQHPIQMIEGWGQGGNPQDPRLIEPAKKTAFSALEKSMGMRGELETLGTEMFGRGWRGFEHTPRIGQLVLQEWMKRNPKRIREFRASVALMQPEGALFDAYQKVSGENEARNTATRRDMTPEQQAERPSWETEDYPAEEQILHLAPNPAPLIPYEPPKQPELPFSPMLPYQMDVPNMDPLAKPVGARRTSLDDQFDLRSSLAR